MRTRHIPVPPPAPRSARWRRRRPALVASLVTALLAAGATAVVAGPAAASEAPSPATVVAQLTGVDATTDTAAQWGVTGTDLGIMWDDGAGGVLTAFGDTFGDWTGPGGGGGDWRSNVLLRSTDTDLADGMTFDSAVEDTPGHAGEIIPSLKQPGVEHTTIPTAGIEVDGVQYLAFMSVRQWGPPGQWDTNFSRIAYSSDGGQTWNSTDGPTWENPGAATSEGDHPFQMVAFERRDGYLYMFGTPNGRLGAAHVARVAEADILDKAAYEYWTGEGWESGEGADVRAAEIVAPNVAELSVRYDAHSQRWLMTHLDQNLDLVLLSAPSPEGPWADRQVVASFADYPGLYGGYIHPWSPDGELYIALSQWDPYNVFLIRVGLTADGQISRANLLADPSFERQPSTATSDPWVCSGNCGTDNNHTWAFAGGKNGFVRNDSGWNSLHQTVRVEPNTDYRFSAWLRTSPNNDAGYVGVRGSNFQVISEHNFQAVADWTRYDVAFNSGDRTSVQVFAGIWTNNGDMWLQVDDFSLARATDPPPAPDPGSVDLRVRAHVQCRGGEAVVEVTAQNRERTPSDIRIVTAWGDARFTGVERNDRVSERFETGTDELDAGTLYVDGYTWRDDRAQNQRYEVDYRARSC